jgi:hypothetical protein
MGDAERVRFGRVVHARREELGLTREDVAALGGPSDATQMRVEAGDGSVPRLATRNKFDAPLRWAAGSAARVWAGGEPSHEDVAPPVPSADPVPSWSPLRLPRDIPLTEDALTSLLVAVRKLQDANRSSRSPVPQEITHLVDAIGRSATGLAQEWLRNAIAHASHSDQPIVDFLFTPSELVRI